MPPFDKISHPSKIVEPQPLVSPKESPSHEPKQESAKKNPSEQNCKTKAKEKPLPVKKDEKQRSIKHVEKEQDSSQHEDDFEEEFFNDKLSPSHTSCPTDFVKVITISKEIRISYSKNPATGISTTSHDQKRLSKAAPSPPPSKGSNSKDPKEPVKPDLTQTQPLLKPDHPKKDISQPSQLDLVPKISSEIVSWLNPLKRFINKFSTQFWRRLPSLKGTPGPPPQTKPTGPMTPVEKIIDYKFTDPILLQKAILSNGHTLEESYALALLGDSLLTQIVVEDGYRLNMNRGKPFESQHVCFGRKTKSKKTNQSNY